MNKKKNDPLVGLASAAGGLTHSESKHVLLLNNRRNIYPIHRASSSTIYRGLRSTTLSLSFNCNPVSLVQIVLLEYIPYKDSNGSNIGYFSRIGYFSL